MAHEVCAGCNPHVPGGDVLCPTNSNIVLVFVCKVNFVCLENNIFHGILALVPRGSKNNQ